ncbi:hypothetical protein K461DRAFT_171886 [Myriangium duriaei CBS 260.36]|uniref:Uncharacterized protein n=1 Tax=Myriangium duriaei CBS 260.36 TaxID=1168546 RepID=A0A9P4IWS7_9PEZI|nr:hypothetical protein K461DRAFT_171886 [Myriangium duriaei CBS 260.36]
MSRSAVSRVPCLVWSGDYLFFRAYSACMSKYTKSAPAFYPAPSFLPVRAPPLKPPSTFRSSLSRPAVQSPLRRRERDHPVARDGSSQLFAHQNATPSATPSRRHSRSIHAAAAAAVAPPCAQDMAFSGARVPPYRTTLQWNYIAHHSTVQRSAGHFTPCRSPPPPVS